MLQDLPEPEPPDTLTYTRDIFTSVHTEIENRTECFVNKEDKEEICECAFKIYQLAGEENLFRAKNEEEIVLTALYVTYNAYDYPTLVRDFEIAFGYGRDTLLHSYRYLLSNLSIMVLQTSPEPYIERFFDTLELSEAAIRRGKSTLNKAEENNVNFNGSSRAIASGLTYIVSQYYDTSITQDDVSAISDTSPVTLRKWSSIFESYVIE